MVPCFLGNPFRGLAGSPRFFTPATDHQSFRICLHPHFARNCEGNAGCFQITFSFARQELKGVLGKHKRSRTCWCTWVQSGGLRPCPVPEGHSLPRCVICCHTPLSSPWRAPPLWEGRREAVGDVFKKFSNKRINELKVILFHMGGNDYLLSPGNRCN